MFLINGIVLYVAFITILLVCYNFGFILLFSSYLPYYQEAKRSESHSKDITKQFLFLSQCIYSSTCLFPLVVYQEEAKTNVNNKIIAHL